MDTADKVHCLFLLILVIGFGWGVTLLPGAEGWRLFWLIVGLAALAWSAVGTYLIITCPPEDEDNGNG